MIRDKYGLTETERDTLQVNAFQSVFEVLRVTEKRKSDEERFVEAIILTSDERFDEVMSVERVREWREVRATAFKVLESG